MNTGDNRSEYPDRGAPADHSGFSSGASEFMPPASGQWASAPASDPPRRKSGLLRGTAGYVVATFLILSSLLLAFAGGMVVEREIATRDAEAAGEGPPQAFDRAWELVETKYVDPEAVNEDRMLEAAIDGLLETLEDEGHTRYLTPEEARANSEGLSGQYVGVGIHVEETEDGIVVVAPIDGSPAQDAGVMPGDLLISVDGKDVTGMPVDQVIPTIRGEEGTQVTLQFRREGQAQPLTFELTRTSIQVSAVSWTMLPGNIADIRLSQFSDGAGDDLARALTEAREAGAAGIVVDLRNNPGGYIHEALRIGSTFVPEGETIFITQVRDGSQTPHLATRQDVHIGDLPLVVLINEGSASSSEIVAGAVKANNPNATVIGETTFGTGTVLSNFGLGDGSEILLGTELWLTPEGKLIKNRGIRPDIAVGLPDGHFPFVPLDNAEVDFSSVTDYQLDWALSVLLSGQAGVE